MRLVFTKPIELDREAKLFRDKIDQYDGVLTETTLAAFLSTDEIVITKRDVRRIAERFNKRKYIGQSNEIKYHKYKSRLSTNKYHKVIKDSERASKEVSVRKWDSISSLTTYKIYLEDMGKFEDDDTAIQLSMIDKLLNKLENDKKVPVDFWDKFDKNGKHIIVEGEE